MKNAEFDPENARKAPRNYRGSSSEERRLERRSKLISASKSLYGTRGFHATTVKAICEAAGLTERYFYENFSNSEDLFIAMHKDTSSRIISRLHMASIREAEPSKKVIAMLDTYYGDIAEDPVTARLFAVDAASISQLAREVCTSWRQSFAHLLSEALSQKTPSSDVLRHGVIRGVIGIGVDWMESGFALARMDVVQAGATLVRAMELGTEEGAQVTAS
ncbi:TetR/AcrR family transcriptional regulator [Pseudomonas sp. BN605]|uniref:TetR/AcrR family transcriptional regulator n=1 Tax=Pseudomonas hunanensis TaxID=1247546 RepID=A0ABD6MVX8_9PSED|nr:MULTISPECIES: TetR/AcrR family transcriptional regulator [Pseudomonas]MDH4847954.1 TetR/AcrR family transcriptional regulator [Pseudomonas sp. BN605]NWL45617.1 TetR/AcrR family transcriptional regulator [Pseudomonas hunanensis]